jgi:hypothetical protein
VSRLFATPSVSFRIKPRGKERFNRLLKIRSAAFQVVVLIVLFPLLIPDRSHAECTVETGGNDSGATYSMRLSASCTEPEREARAVSASDILAVLASGRGIDLAGVVIDGDLLLDELPLGKIAAIQDLSLEDRRVLNGLPDEPVRTIRGPVIIKNSRVRGQIVNRLKQGYLLVLGPVVLAQTHFQGPLDLSRTVFLGMVDASRASFEAESYFVQARFTQGAIFSETHFGPHTRFHRSIFGGPSIFRSALFKGLAEFLEVVFEQDANLSHASFHMGTGFSGAHCRGKCDFSFAQFNREAFFLFALFDRSVSFASARFQAQADFSDALFKERDDLAEAVFAQPPLLTRTVRVTTTIPSLLPAGPQGSHILTVVLLLMALGLLIYAVKAK